MLTPEYHIFVLILWFSQKTLTMKGTSYHIETATLMLAASMSKIAIGEQMNRTGWDKTGG